MSTNEKDTKTFSIASDGVGLNLIPSKELYTGAKIPVIGLGTFGSDEISLFIDYLFIDFKEKYVWGIDGLLIESFEFDDGNIKISAEIIQNKNYIIIKAREIPIYPVEININGIALGVKEQKKLNQGFIFQFN